MQEILQLKTRLQTLFDVLNPSISKTLHNDERLKYLIDEACQVSPYFTCQLLVYCRRELHAPQHICNKTAALMASHLSGKEYAKDFYSNKGIIFSPEDMQDIAKYLGSLDTDLSTKNLSNAMKRGFRETIESYDGYTLLKQRKNLVNIINLVRPRPLVSGQTILYNNSSMYVLDLITKGLKTELWVREDPTPLFNDYGSYDPDISSHINKIEKIKI